MYGFYEYKEKQYTFKQVADMLKIGRNNMLKDLRELNYLNHKNEPTAKGLKNGLVAESASKLMVGSVPSTKVTQIGINLIEKLFEPSFVIIEE